MTTPWCKFPNPWGQGCQFVEMKVYQFVGYNLSICRKLVKLSICRLSICRLSIIRPPQIWTETVHHVLYKYLKFYRVYCSYYMYKVNTYKQFIQNMNPFAEYVEYCILLDIKANWAYNGDNNPNSTNMFYMMKWQRWKWTIKS